MLVVSRDRKEVFRCRRRMKAESHRRVEEDKGALQLGVESMRLEMYDVTKQGSEAGDVDAGLILCQVELLDLCVKSFQTDAKDFCCCIFVPSHDFQYTRDVSLLEVRHRNCASYLDSRSVQNRVLFSKSPAAQGKGKVFNLNDIVLAQNPRSFDNILQFANVTGPLIL